MGRNAQTAEAGDKLDTSPISDEDNVLDDEEGDDDRGDDPYGLRNWWHAPVREDPWGRWQAGEEPMRELEIVAIDADASGTSIVRNTSIEIKPGVIPDPDHNYEDDGAYFDLRFVSRWNATWRGARLVALSLDMFSQDWPEVLRLTFDPSHQVDLLCAYHASYPGITGIYLCNHGTPVLTARGDPLGHQVACRDPRLALRIGARYPGVATHAAFLQSDLWHPREPESEEGRALIAGLREAAQWVAGEPVLGARATMQDERLQSLARVLANEFEPPPALTDPLAASLDSFSLIATGGLQKLAGADLVRANRQILDGLAAHVTYADAVEAIRRSDPDRLPLWIDFTDSAGEPQRRRQGAGIEQPLYGALVSAEREEEAGSFYAVVIVGRACGLEAEALPLCALGIGPDDEWRYPIPEHQISLLTAHSGGVVVRHVSVDFHYDGVQPSISERELDYELSRTVQRTSEWVLARIGAVLTALDDGLVLLQRADGEHTYDLVRAPTSTTGTRPVPLPDPMTIAARLRELGSLHRVAQKDSIDPTAAYEALELAGVDPDQVLRDEALLRWRRTGSVEAVVAATHLQRDLVERYLLQAGIDASDTPIPHDVTDPNVLAAITAYRQTGGLDAAGEHLGVSSETVRRRIAQAGLAVEEIETDAQRRVTEETLEAWERAGHSLVGAARDLHVDPRTIKQRLHRAGIGSITPGRQTQQRKQEAQALHAQLGSLPATAAVMGLSTQTVRRLLSSSKIVAVTHNPSPARANGGRVSQGQLNRALAAYQEHGSVRAAARAVGLSTGGMAYRLKLARAHVDDEAQDSQDENNKDVSEQEGR